MGPTLICLHRQFELYFQAHVSFIAFIRCFIKANTTCIIANVYTNTGRLAAALTSRCLLIISLDDDKRIVTTYRTILVSNCHRETRI